MSDSSFEALITRYIHRGILVDSSLLVVYLVGIFDHRQLLNCRAIKSSFSQAEFDLLRNLLAEFDAIITTPHVLTEVSNLAGRLPRVVHSRFREFFARVMTRLTERSVAAIEIASAEHFIRFGMADTAITLIAPGEFLVLTEELALFDYLSRNGVDVLNFNHIRLAA